MHPGAAVDDTQHQDAPLLGRPSGMEPARLTQHAEDAGPPVQAAGTDLRQPGRESAEQRDCDLVPGVGPGLRSEARHENRHRSRRAEGHGI